MPAARRWPVAAALSALLLCLAFLPGCAGLIYTDPGPNPARLTVPVKAQVDRSLKDDFIATLGGPEFLNSPPRYDTVSGPYWDVQAFILAPDGGLHQLPPAPGGAILNQEGFTVEGRAQFLCPPGRHQLRLVMHASLLHVFYTYFDVVKVYVPLFVRYDLPQVELYPGREVVLEGLLTPR